MPRRSTAWSPHGSRMLQVNVARLHEDNREALALAWVAGRDGGTTVRREAVAAASLIGHLNLTHPNSIQVIGAYEAGIVAGFIERLLEPQPAAVIIADGVAPPPPLVEAASRCHTPLFTSPLPAPRVIEKLARYLAKALAETVERHGVFMDVLGVAVRKVTLPVAAGRNLAVLVEAAVRNEILKLRGIDSTAEFLARQRGEMQKDK